MSTPLPTPESVSSVFDYETSDPFPDDNCTNITDFRQAERPLSTLVKLSVSLVTFVLGVTGNLTLIYLIRRTERRLSNPSLFIVNMAIGDMIFLLINVPSYCSVLLSSQWYGDTAGCKLTYFVRYLTLGVSIFTLVALSTDRYFAIARPFKHTNNRRRVLCVIGLIWLLAAAFATPATLGARQLTHLFTDSCQLFRYCDVSLPGQPLFVDGLLWFKLITYFLLPLVLIASFYGAMTVVLCRSSFLDAGAGSSNGILSSAAASRQVATAMRRTANRKKLARTVLCLVAMFIVCWLPINAYSIHYFVMDNVSMTFKAVAVQLTFVYSCVNPITLFVMSKRFRREFRLNSCCRRHSAAAQSDSAPLGSTSWADMCHRRPPQCSQSSMVRHDWRYCRPQVAFSQESVALKERQENVGERET